MNQNHPNKKHKTNLPPGSDNLPSGYFPTLPLPDIKAVYKTLYLLWDKNDDDTSTLFRTSKVNVPSKDEADGEGENTNEFSGRFLRLAQDSLERPYTMLVREEYDEVLKMIEDRVSLGHEGGCVIIGRPGIGKSVFLVYLLLSRILRGLNTFVRTASLFFSFTALGFTSFTDQPSFETYIADSGLTNIEGILIYDANEGIQPPYIPNASVCWPVLLSSPKSAYLKSWVDQTGAILIWMKPWTWNEFFSACYTLRVSQHNRLREIFTLCGPVLRHADDALKTDVDEFIQRHRKKVSTALVRMKRNGPRVLISALEAIQTADSHNDENLSSLIFILQPDEDRFEPYLDTVTAELCDRVLDVIEEASGEEQQMFSALLSSTPVTASAKGNLFKSRYICQLRRNLEKGQLTTISGTRTIHL